MPISSSRGAAVWSSLSQTQAIHFNVPPPSVSWPLLLHPKAGYTLYNNISLFLLSTSFITFYKEDFTSFT